MRQREQGDARERGGAGTVGGHRHGPSSADDAYAGGRPRLRTRDVWALIWSTYRTSAPYLVVFLLLFVLAVWLVTEVLFR